MNKICFRRNALSRLTFLILFSTSAYFSFSQTDKLHHSIDYINDQFKNFNPYNLKFEIDYEGKNLISHSIYFEVTYPINQLSSIYFTERGENDCIIFFKCQNESQCISSLNMKDKSTDLKTEYSFNLETTPDIAEKVVMEFMAIKNGMNNNIAKEVVIPVINNGDLNADIEFINKMLKKYNSFDLQYSINWNKKQLQSQSTYFEITYDPSTLNNMELIARGENDYKINFTCKSDAYCLTRVDLRDNNIEHKSNYPINFSGKADEAQKMINTFNHILQNLK